MANDADHARHVLPFELAPDGRADPDRPHPVDDGAAVAAVHARHAVLTFNIAISVIVMLVAMATLKPLDFRSSRPSFSSPRCFACRSTLPRPGSCCCTTIRNRMPPAKVIEAFGHFLVGGNYAVGIVVFRDPRRHQLRGHYQRVPGGLPKCRRASHSMPCPGKQMAIDADLNAGLIGGTRRASAGARSPTGRLLRIDGRCLEIRSRRRRRRHHHAHQRHRRPLRRCASTTWTSDRPPRPIRC